MLALLCGDTHTHIHDTHKDIKSWVERRYEWERRERGERGEKGKGIVNYNPNCLLCRLVPPTD